MDTQSIPHAAPKSNPCSILPAAEEPAEPEPTTYVRCAGCYAWLASGKWIVLQTDGGYGFALCGQFDCIHDLPWSVIKRNVEAYTGDTYEEVAR